jgi:small subunit ribosomal protein S7
MSRKCAATKRAISPDRKYGSQVVAKFINCVMQNGKKSVAEDLVYKAFDALEKEKRAPALEVFNSALENILPAVEMRSLRAGGVNYRIPVPIKTQRAQFIAMNWLIREMRKRTGASFDKKMFAELCDAHAKRGGAFKRYEENLKMAESGRAFSHFRFFNSARKQ